MYEIDTFITICKVNTKHCFLSQNFDLMKVIKFSITRILCMDMKCTVGQDQLEGARNLSSAREIIHRMKDS